ncbi:hypothetical protein PTTG_30543 [Puccinia triticina 1-1 BBBD Race 1]|uniref:Uncharacterized protein n=1 Tax=Puccinia triticina (isolate 1-1 / race 1 (BBBD)) TaxID=630390 RepID=A0A180FYN2_PUCT1|nr:hypothetical protein PTTG_30543 [Puccinia triticina 1-1 BBBD Race 1]
MAVEWEGLLPVNCSIWQYTRRDSSRSTVTYISRSGGTPPGQLLGVPPGQLPYQTVNWEESLPVDCHIEQSTGRSPSLSTAISSSRPGEVPPGQQPYLAVDWEESLPVNCHI